MGRLLSKGRVSRIGFGVLAALAALSLTSASLAEVRRKGTWPDKDKRVSLDLRRVPRDEAIKKLAEEAGWSVVVHAPNGDPVDVRVKDQPAGKVLDLLLLDSTYEARRDGELISIVRVGAAAADEPVHPEGVVVPPVPPIPPVLPVPPVPPVPAAPPEPPAPPAPPAIHVRGPDRIITGDSITIEKGDIVHDVSVFGGSLKVLGTVTGDVNVMGGSVRIREGGFVMGDAAVLGGSLTVEDGGRIDGDVELVGGALKRGEKAIIGGDVKGDGHPWDHARRHAREHREAIRAAKEAAEEAARRAKEEGKDAKEAKEAAEEAKEAALEAAEEAREAREEAEEERQEAMGAAAFAGDDDHREGTGSRLAREAGSAISSMALLFVLGAVLLSLAPKRMETLKLEIASRPMRSFAMGVVGVLMSIVIVVAMCVTIIGIPFAIIGLLLGFVAAWGGVCAVLETVGGALVGHRTKNSYMHLAAGCGLFLLVTAIPYIGGLVFTAVMLAGIGSLVSTRLAGLIKPKYPAQTNGGAPPYRSAPAEAEL